MLSWSDKLYTYGFLLTTDETVDLRKVGVNNNIWKVRPVGGCFLHYHPNVTVYDYAADGRHFVLFGHAYNPFTMEADENGILLHLSQLYGKSGYDDYFDQLTGMFFYAVLENNRHITAVSDCAGEYGAYYAEYGGNIYFSSYAQLIADILHLTEDPYVTKLKNSRFFHMYGRFLPGNLSPYKEIRRILPNTRTVYDGSFRIERFYPRIRYEALTGDSYEQQVKEIGQILHNTLLLISQKWARPAISLTGGTDSQTTLACTGNQQNDFRYFSYVSLPREETDAQAASKICNALGLSHSVFRIDTNPETYPEYGTVADMVERHSSYIGKGNQNDICKRLGLNNLIDFDVEVKSWVSEVARASRNKMYSKKKMPRKMTPRRLTTMYKIFAFNRRDAVATDKRFKQYMEESGLQEAIVKTGYTWSEFFVWEIVFGGWGSLALTGEHRLTNDITIPYNNRALLDMMLRTPLEKRRTDTLHWDIIQAMKPELSNLNIHVVNGNETKAREIFERVYFDIHSHLPY